MGFIWSKPKVGPPPIETRSVPFNSFYYDSNFEELPLPAPAPRSKRRLLMQPRNTRRLRYGGPPRRRHNTTRRGNTRVPVPTTILTNAAAQPLRKASGPHTQIPRSRTGSIEESKNDEYDYEVVASNNNNNNNKAEFNPEILKARKVNIIPSKINTVEPLQNSMPTGSGPHTPIPRSRSGSMESNNDEYVVITNNNNNNNPPIRYGGFKRTRKRHSQKRIVRPLKKTLPLSRSAR